MFFFIINLEKFSMEFEYIQAIDLSKKGEYYYTLYQNSINSLTRAIGEKKKEKLTS